MGSLSRIVLLIFLKFLIFNNVQSANILGVFTSLSPSHVIVHMSMVQVLAENGHNVTVITTLKPKISHKNIHVIHVALSEDEERQLNDGIENIAKQGGNTNIIKTLYNTITQMDFFFQKMYDCVADPRVTSLYEQETNNFDLVMMGYFMNQYQLGIAQKLKVPVIITAAMPLGESLANMVANPTDSTYLAGVTFAERLKFFGLRLAFRVFFGILNSENSKYYSQLYGDDPNMPQYTDLTKNVSLIFFNSHGLSEGPIQPLVPGIIEVGGVQIKEQPAELPKHLAEFIDNAPHGAILLSLGSNLKGVHLKADTVGKMFNVLSQLKQRVIWKWENLDQTPGKADNILYAEWLPQDDILAHPNIKLFITHAGKGGVSEAQYHGKPMLALPAFADQPRNAQFLVKSGFGLTLQMSELEEQSFHDSIHEIILEKKYAENVKRFSKLYRDRPMTARQSVLYWTEYVLRHHGAQHIQSPAVHMSIIQVMNLDVYILIITLLVVFAFILKIMFKSIIKRLCKKKVTAIKNKIH